MNDRFTSTPEGWAPVDKSRLASAVALVEVVLSNEAVVDNAAAYYRRDGNYAGQTFLGLGPIDPYSFTPGDLLALNLLSVAAPPAAIRRLLEPSRERGRLLRLLGEEHLPLDADLAMADSDQLLAMAGLHEELKHALSANGVKKPNSWVTASKLCARKRPDLFPVRDGIVSDYLHLGGSKQNYQVDWQVYRHVIQDQGVRTRLDEIIDAACKRPGVDVGHPNRRLRHLDVLLWMHARPKDRRAHKSGDLTISAPVDQPEGAF